MGISDGCWGVCKGLGFRGDKPLASMCSPARAGYKKRLGKPAPGQKHDFPGFAP